MGKFRDMKGQKFNKLLILESVKHYQGRHTFAKCQCDCGNIKFIKQSDVISGKSKTCGCLVSETMAKIGSLNKKQNEYVFYENYFAIKVGEREILLDLEDFDLIKNLTIYIDNRGYARISNRTDVVLLHRYIMSAYVNTKYIDHINHNTLDNRRNNLRFCNESENMMNRKVCQSNSTTGVKGVHYHKKNDNFIAYIDKDNKRTHLGSFDNIDDAVEVRIQADKEMYKEFSNMKDDLK